MTYNPGAEQYPGGGEGDSGGIAAPRGFADVIDEFLLALGAIGTSFGPIKLFRFSFAVAAILCLLYSIELPVLFYFATHRVLLSDVSVYYFSGAIALFLTEKALKDFDERIGSNT